MSENIIKVIASIDDIKVETKLGFNDEEWNRLKNNEFMKKRYIKHHFLPLLQKYFLTEEGKEYNRLTDELRETLSLDVLHRRDKIKDKPRSYLKEEDLNIIYPK